MINSKKLISAGIILLISVIVSLYMIESYLRYFYHIPNLIAPYYPLGSMVSGARIKVVQREYTVDTVYNNQGFRDKEIIFKKNGNKTIILFLGDSFIEGQGVAVENRASSLVEKSLNKQHVPQKYLAINAGQLATNPISYFENFVSFGIALKPAIVVIGIFMGNDFMDSRSNPVSSDYVVNETLHLKKNGVANFYELGFLREFIKQLLTHKTHIVKKFATDKFWNFYYKEKIDANWYIKKSGLPKDEFMRRIKSFEKNVIDDFFHGKINPSYLLMSLKLMHINDESNVPFYNQNDILNVFNLINEMNIICGKRNIKLLVVIYPDAFSVMKEEYTSHLITNLHMEKIPKQLFELEGVITKFIFLLKYNKIPFIDLTGELTKKDYYLFDGHLNTHGQAIAAVNIARALNMLDKIKK